MMRDQQLGPKIEALMFSRLVIHARSDHHVEFLEPEASRLMVVQLIQKSGGPNTSRTAVPSNPLLQYRRGFFKRPSFSSSSSAAQRHSRTSSRDSRVKSSPPSSSLSEGRPIDSFFKQMRKKLPMRDTYPTNS